MNSVVLRIPRAFPCISSSMPASSERSRNQGVLAAGSGLLSQSEPCSPCEGRRGLSYVVCLACDVVPNPRCRDGGEDICRRSFDAEGMHATSSPQVISAQLSGQAGLSVWQCNVLNNVNVGDVPYCVR